MITPALLTTTMLQDLQHGAQVHTHGGRRLFADCQIVLAFYAKDDSHTGDKTAVRDAQQRICDHLNAKHEADNTRERKMFGCTTAALDEALKGMTSRDIAMYAMSTLSNAQELIHKRHNDSWYIGNEDANALRQLINIAKYAMDKAVPR